MSTKEDSKQFDGHSPGPWQMATSCSFRRIIDARGREIVGGTVQCSDGHPDLHFTNGGYEGSDARLILAAPSLLAERDSLQARCEELEKALVHAVSLIQDWHNMGVPEKEASKLWDIYWRNAPELKSIRAALLSQSARGET